MTPSTLTTIINSAPMIIQGAGKLIDLIRERGKQDADNEAQDRLTPETLQADIQDLESRLTAVDESNIEQIKLIEQLARQNEVLAESLRALDRQARWISLIAVMALLLAVLALVLVLR